jgi:cobalt-zinc-cadmium efflux system membrane fusion protein
VRALRIEPVTSRDFRPERMAEGRIAYNDDRSTPMLSPYTGRVMRAFARVGDRVAMGAPLYEIETPDVTGAANDLLGALDNVQKANVALAQARREDARQASLFSARASSQRDVEQARAASAAAESDLRSANAQAEANRDRLRVLGRTPDQIAEIERTRQVSGVITVTAPLAGTITQRRAGPGQWLTAGQGDPVFTIADLSTMWLVANVREMDVPMIREGQTVDVTVNALPNKHFDARIVRTAAGLDPTTRRLTVMAEVPDPNYELRPEMFATFRIEVGDMSRGPAVPASAVIFRGSEANVWVALPEGRFVMRRITPGIRSDNMIEARAGLAEGDRVVTGGALFIDRASRID